MCIRDRNLYNKNVLVVEDIVDTGTTLKYLLEKLNERHPKTLKVCTMLDKPSRRTADFHADYIGFQVEDLFVIGYGLDYDQKYRNLPYISYLQNEGKMCIRDSRNRPQDGRGRYRCSGL